MSTVIQLTPCVDWFYLEWSEHNSEWTVIPVAAWGLTSEGESLGMLPVSGTRNSGRPGYPHLVPAPAVGGKFVHLSKLSDKQLTTAKARPY